MLVYILAARQGFTFSSKGVFAHTVYVRSGKRFPYLVKDLEPGVTEAKVVLFGLESLYACLEVTKNMTSEFE